MPDIPDDARSHYVVQVSESGGADTFIGPLDNYTDARRKAEALAAGRGTTTWILRALDRCEFEAQVRTRPLSVAPFPLSPKGNL